MWFISLKLSIISFKSKMSSDLWIHQVGVVKVPLPHYYSFHGLQ
jgi:hypothetical protein